MEQSKERPVFTEHPPMSKIIRAEATKFPVLDQAQPESAKKLYDAFHDNTDDTCGDGSINVTRRYIRGLKSVFCLFDNSTDHWKK